MKIGLQLPSFTWPGGPPRIGGTLVEFARAAESAGFYSLWVMDHFFQISMGGPPEMEMLEGYSTLAFCAAATKTIKLGTMATGVIYRYPGVLVKTVTTLDVLSGGRAYLGIGAAWFEKEAKGLGVPFPPLKTRFEMLEETLQIAKQMWSGRVAPYRGKHFQLEETLCSPQPLARPHPPILVAGGGETRTLRLVAQYADACNIYGSVEEIARKYGILKRHCEDLGRDYETVEKTALLVLTLKGSPPSAKEIVAQCEALAKIGADHVLFSFADLQNVKPLDIFGKEIIPAVAGL
jgi:F420-dependent oxidoreductase-like protein